MTLFPKDPFSAPSLLAPRLQALYSLVQCATFSGLTIAAGPPGALVHMTDVKSLVTDGSTSQPCHLSPLRPSSAHRFLQGYPDGHGKKKINKIKSQHINQRAIPVSGPREKHNVPKFIPEQWAGGTNGTELWPRGTHYTSQLFPSTWKGRRRSIQTD